MSKKKKAVKVNLNEFLASSVGGPPVVTEELLPTAPRYASYFSFSIEKSIDLKRN